MPHPYKKDYLKQSLLVKQFLDVKDIQGGMCEHQISQAEWALFFLTFPIKSYGKIFLRRRVVKDSVAVPQLYPISNYVHPSKSHTQIKSSTCHGKMINYSKKILSNI